MNRSYLLSLWLLANQPPVPTGGTMVIFDDNQGNKVLVRCACLPEKNEEFYLLASHIVDVITGCQNGFVERSWRVKSIDPEGEKYPVCKVIPIRIKHFIRRKK